MFLIRLWTFLNKQIEIIRNSFAAGIDVVLSNNFQSLWNQALPPRTICNAFRTDSASTKFDSFHTQAFYWKYFTCLAFLTLRLCKSFLLNSLLDVTQWNICSSTLLINYWISFFVTEIPPSHVGCSVTHIKYTNSDLFSVLWWDSSVTV